MQYSGLGLTEDSTWGEVIDALKEHFPDMYYLYNLGDDCKIFTGGYVAESGYSKYSGNTGGCLYFYSLGLATNASGYYGYLRTVNPVEIKKEHISLKCHIETASQVIGQLWFYVGTGATTMTKNIKILAYDTVAFSDKEFTIDISELEGNYYVGFAIASGGKNTEHATVYIDKIWVE